MSFENIIQAKVDALDSNSTVAELLELAHAAAKYDLKSVYDSAGLMPTTDSADIGRIAFAENNNGMYVLVGLDSGWQLIDSDAAGAEDDASGNPNPSAGSSYGYAMGGAPWPTGGDVIERFSFTADGNSSDVGDLTHAHYAGGVGQTLTHAYYMGGTESLAPIYYTNRIQKIQFASSGNSTELSYYLTGQRTRFQNGVHTTPTHAFLAGGYRSPGGMYSEIQKYSYTDDANASDTGGDLTAGDADFGGQMSETHGYLTGGTPSVNNPLLGIRKYPFSITSGSEASVGDLTPQYTTQHDQSGASSSTHGYVFSGTIINAIEKFPFAADANSTDVGDLNQMAWRAGATQSTTHGYNLGGSSPSAAVNNIQKFDFSTDEDGTDVGDLTVARTYVRGAAE